MYLAGTATSSIRTPPISTLPPTLLVAVDERDGTVVATAALDSRGPAHPPNPRVLAERYPSGETAQLAPGVYASRHRRHGLARRLVASSSTSRWRTAAIARLSAHRSGGSGRRGVLAVPRQVVYDEREEPGGGQGIVHFEVPLP